MTNCFHYDYKIKNERISIFGNVGIATFVLNQSGILVDSQTYTGQHMTVNGRATFVLVKEITWKIMHYHLDQIPE